MELPEKYKKGSHKLGYVVWTHFFSHFFFIVLTYICRVCLGKKIVLIVMLLERNGPKCLIISVIHRDVTATYNTVKERGDQPFYLLLI